LLQIQELLAHIARGLKPILKTNLPLGRPKED